MKHVDTWRRSLIMVWWKACVGTGLEPTCTCTQKVILGLVPFVINKYIMRRYFEITFACA